MNRFKLTVAAAAVVLVSAPAVAAPIAPTDFGALGSLGDSVAPQTTDNLIAPGGQIVGSLTNDVFFDGSIYTYVHQVTPTINNVSEFNTGFDVLGFTGTAGYSFSDAASVGTSFTIDEDPDGSVDWTTPGLGNWDSGELITFFYQSSLPPGLGDYNLIDTFVGTGQSYAPVPVPPAALLFGSALVLMVGLARRQQGSRSSGFGRPRRVA